MLYGASRAPDNILTRLQPNKVGLKNDGWFTMTCTSANGKAETPIKAGFILHSKKTTTIIMN